MSISLWLLPSDKECHDCGLVTVTYIVYQLIASVRVLSWPDFPVFTCFSLPNNAIIILRSRKNVRVIEQFKHPMDFV